MLMVLTLPALAMSTIRLCETAMRRCESEAGGSVRFVGRDLKTLISWSAESLPGLTQQDIAEAVGTSQQTVSRWLSGLTIPPLDRIPALARVIEVDETELAEAYLAESKKQSARVPRIKSLSDLDRRLAAVETRLEEAIALLQELVDKDKGSRRRKAG